MIDGVTDELVGGFGVVSQAWQVLVDSAGGKLYCSNFLDNKVTVLDARTHILLEDIDVGQRPCYMCQNPVDRRVYVGNRDDNTVSVIRDSASSGVETSLPGPTTRSAAVAAGRTPSSGILNIQPAPGLNQDASTCTACRATSWRGFRRARTTYAACRPVPTSCAPPGPDKPPGSCSADSCVSGQCTGPVANHRARPESCSAHPLGISNWE